MPNCQEMAAPRSFRDAVYLCRAAHLYISLLFLNICVACRVELKRCSNSLRKGCGVTLLLITVYARIVCITRVLSALAIARVLSVLFTILAIVVCISSVIHKSNYNLLFSYIACSLESTVLHTYSTQ